MKPPVAKVVKTLRDDPMDIAKAKRMEAEGGLPESSGFYAWWTRRGSIPSVPRAPHPDRKKLDLFYVGIAPNGPGSSATVRSRVIGNHLSGNTGSSTFRFTLAALLLKEMGLHPRRTASKVVLAAEENAGLSSWQKDHLYLTWCVVEEPWTLEGEVIAAMQPPLNLSANYGHTFHQTLTEARRTFRQAAV